MKLQKCESDCADLEDNHEDDTKSTDDEGLDPSPEQIAHELELKKAQ